jgi:predicted nucleic-acid-binding protein
MIAIDTNVLLRYLLMDDIAQATKAAALITGSDSVLITDVVLTETLWTLKGKKYRLDKKNLLTVMEALFKEPNVRFEDNHVVWCALQDYRQADFIKVAAKKKQADLSDALVVNKARWLAQRFGESFKGMYTFDRAAQQIEGTMQP